MLFDFSNPQPQEIVMDLTKSFLTSRTIWANLVGLIALLLSLFGIDASGIGSPEFLDAILQAIAGVSFVLSTLFRMMATRRIA
jgi:hypothetical protein